MINSHPEQASSLMRFARAVYAVTGIQALCLRLQDEHDVDVVLMLTGCWYGCYFGELNMTQRAQMTAFAEQWRTQLVQPLRQARRWLKPHPADAAGIPAQEQEALRQGIKALELDAEFMQLRALASLLTIPVPASQVVSESQASANIRINLGQLCAPRSAPVTGPPAALSGADLAALTRACLLSR